MNQETQMNVQITEAAASQIKALVQDHGDAFVGVRLMVKGGGCSGMQYDFAFVLDPEEDDLRFYQDDALLIVDPMSIMYLDGSTLDYTEELAGSQFVIRNPSVRQKCGCGNSFSA